MKLVMMEFVTLDGISQGPGSPDEDRSDGFTLGGWFVPFIDDEFMGQNPCLDARSGCLPLRSPHLPGLR